MIRYWRVLFFVLVGSLSSLPSLAQAPDVTSGTIVGLLDKHCARCHQLEKTVGKYKDRPAGNFGFVLDLDKLQKGGTYIKAGNAENSVIYQKIYNGEMPFDFDASCSTKEQKPDAYCGVSSQELASLASYINGMKVDAAPGSVAAANTTSPTNAKRAFVSDAQVTQAIAADLNRVSEVRRKNIRYVTFTHLWNGGDQESNFDLYRMALTKLVNSLSQRPDVVKLQAVDSQKTIYRLDISDLGWDAAKWDKIIALNPYAVIYRDAAFRAIQSETNTQIPMVRGDWLTFIAAKPPLYYDLLDLPATKQELEKKLGFDSLANVRALRVARAGFLQSGVSQSNRLIERHTMRNGAYWESYDFASSAGDANFFDLPLGPQGAFIQLSSKFGFKHDGGEVIFDLPNGFHAFYLTDGVGKRLAKGPTEIVQDPGRRDFAVTNGISCMGCHTEGMKFNDKRGDAREKMDQVRNQALSSATFSTDAKDIIREIYPLHATFYDLMLGDKQRYEAALAKADISTKARIDGLELVNGLTKRFEQELTPQLAAAEVGMKTEEFLESLNAAGNEFYDLKQRLLQDLVPRDSFVKIYAKLIGKVTENRAVDFTQVSTQVSNYQGTSQIPLLNVSANSGATRTFDLQFFADQPVLLKGQTGRFKVRSEQPCYLTLINTDEKGRRQILFPNALASNNRIEANINVDVPGLVIKGFAFRADEVGTERITAVCNATQSALVAPDAKSSGRVFENNVQYLEAVRRQRSNSRLLTITGDGQAGSPPPILKDPVNPNVDIIAQKTVTVKVIAKPQ